ncbi:DUF559 domain-containing protein [Actinoplanes sp. NPDC051633]|uniref:DUF559 domain-containing protein n=1 Tax=Actinoplanes sp. NPDC051633 TaxID=3155670 RepID=UPI00343AA87C
MGRRVEVPRQLMAGPFRGRDAVARGLVTRDLLIGPSWRRLLPDVYVAADAVTDHRTWCAAVALTLPAAGAVDRYSAAFLHGLDLLPPDAPVTVTVPTRTHLWAHPRVRPFRTALDPADVMRVEGIPVTSPLRTAFDLGRQRHLGPSVVAVDAMCHRHLVTIADLADYARARRQLRGARQLIARLPLVEPRSESVMESRLRMLFVMAGLPTPVAQYEVRDEQGRFVARLDLAWPEAKTAAEYEGDHHREREQFRRDVARLNALRKAGWTILRFTAPDVHDHPDRTVSHMADALKKKW